MIVSIFIYFESLVNSTGYCEMLPPALFDSTILLGASYFFEESSAVVAIAAFFVSTEGMI